MHQVVPATGRHRGGWMTRFRLATFNLESLDRKVGDERLLAQRIEVLQPQLLRLNADILCLQEVSAHSKDAQGQRTMAALDALLAGTRYADYARVSSVGAAGHGPADIHNLVILSRWPCTTSRQIRHELVPPVRHAPVTAGDTVDTAFDRPILYAAIPLPGGQVVHVINLHLRSPLAAHIAGQKKSALVWRSIAGWAEGFFVAALKRDGQALETRLFLERLFDAEPEARIVVCGDFNADGREVPVRMIIGDDDDTGNPALAARSMTAIERNLPDERRFSVRHAGHTVMLDHILISRALLAWAAKAEVHNEALKDEIFDAPPGVPPLGSFHAPVVVEFDAPD
jgi:endonuclease/exonuclease/phosphatase family metal-dependent hydrolase